MIMSAIDRSSTTPLGAPETKAPAPILSEGLMKAISAEVQAYSPMSLHEQERSGLRDMIQQGIEQQLYSLLPTSLNIWDDDKSKGAAMTMAGAMLQGAGKRIAAAGGMTAKVMGGSMIWGGRAAEEIGKDKYDSAGSSSNTNGNYNAYGGFYTGKSTDESSKK